MTDVFLLMLTAGHDAHGFQIHNTLIAHFSVSSHVLEVVSFVVRVSAVVAVVVEAFLSAFDVARRTRNSMMVVVLVAIAESCYFLHWLYSPISGGPC